jgi:hypothetical protein
MNVKENNKIPIIILHYKKNPISYLRRILAWFTRCKTGHSLSLYVAYEEIPDSLKNTYSDIKFVSFPKLDYDILNRELKLIGEFNYYFITSSSILPKENCPSNSIDFLISLARKYPTMKKVGLSLEINDLPEIQSKPDRIIEEEQHWQNLMPDKDAYYADINDSFAVYQRYVQGDCALRSRRPYVARNMEWYNKDCNEGEEAYIMDKQDILTLLIGRTYSYNSIKGIKTEFYFSILGECTGWGGIRGELAVKGRRLRIRWNDSKGTVTVLDFSVDFLNYTGVSTTSGKIFGKLIGKLDTPKTNTIIHRRKGSSGVNHPDISTEVVYINRIKSIAKDIIPIYVVVAGYNIEKRKVDAFLEMNRSVFVSMQINVIVVTNTHYNSNYDNVSYIMYPIEQTQFSIGKTVNYGIRAVQDTSAIIVKTDIDIMFTSNIFNYLRDEVSLGHARICLCSHVSKQQPSMTLEKWEGLDKDKGGLGACFAMHRGDWHKACGYSEDIFGWGHDDTELCRRLEKTDSIDLHSNSDYILLHINHARRATPKVGSFFQDRATGNLPLANNSKWTNPNWGRAGNLQVIVKDSKLITFCMCLKNRSETAIRSIESLVNERTIPYCNFIISEDYSDDLLDLSNFKYAKHIDHYVINTGDKWNRSKTCNYGFRRATTTFVSSWDADFIFPDKFLNTFREDLLGWNFTQTFYGIRVTETGHSYRGGHKFHPGQLYGGMYIYKTKHIQGVNGYDEEFKFYGFEELDANDRICRKYGIDVEYITEHGYIYHLSHGDESRDDMAHYDINKRRMIKNQRGRVMEVNPNGWGDSKLVEKKDYTQKTIVIMGNGPSMKEINFDLIENVDTFGMNGAYRWYYENKWWPKYFGCFDETVIPNHQAEFEKMINDSNVPIKRFFMALNISANDRFQYVNLHLRNSDIAEFGDTFETFGYGGNTGVNCCQVALILGYTKIILVGVDCKYKEIVDGASEIGGKLVITKPPAKNENYWLDDYQKVGDKYNYPKPEIFHRPAWNAFAEFSKEHGVEVVNCSPGSSLDCFRMSTLEEELIT